MKDAQPDKLEALLSGEAHRALWRYCRALAPSREDAEDLLQECLATALLRFGQLRDAAAFKAWLFAIARRCFLDLRRTRAWRERAAAASAEPSALEYGTELTDARPGPDEGGDALSLLLRAELARLPAAQREVLELVYLHGLSVDEAARVLGLLAPAARQRLHRGREALRQRLSAAGVRGPAAPSAAEETP